MSAEPIPFRPAEFPLITLETILELVTSGRYATIPATITPPVAAEILREFNVHNRNPSPLKIGDYARDMVAGRWLAKCGQLISFNTRSELDNGQNRLAACIKAGVPFATLITVGNDPAAFDAIDRGKKRTKSDTLTYHGEGNTTALAAALGMLVNWEQNRLSARYLPTEAEILDALARHPEIRAAADRAARLRRKLRCMPGPMTFAGYLIMRTDRPQAGRFLDRLETGADLAPGDPALVLRESILSGRSASKRRSSGIEFQTQHAAMIVKAWNAHLEGRSIRYLRLIDGEKFPTVRS